MKGIFCCLGGGSSSNTVQHPSEPSEPRDLSTSFDGEDLSFGATFRWSEIVDGTEDFLRANLLGGGNFCQVYRCNFPRTNEVGAAKIHNHEIQYGNTDEFLAEIRTLQEANHPNVIKVMGKYFGHLKSAIVYEFMPNGSLDHHLFGVKRSPSLRQQTRVLDWNTRMRIAVGVAEALVYLHTGLKVIHRDIKVANVLLDDDLAPKLADFGLAAKIGKIRNGVDRPRKIKPVKGTLGYIAPETENFGMVSTKSDVYSYGVLLLVLFTGRKAHDTNKPEAMEITDWVRPVWSRVELIPMVADVALGNKYSVEGLKSLFRTARMCTDAQAKSRPKMEIVEELVRQAAAYPVSELLPVTGRPREV